MQQSSRCSGCAPLSALGETVPLGDVQAELEPIEAIERELSDLTAVLRSLLSPEQFRLVWALRDAVERLGLAEELLHEQQFMNGLIRHLPGSARAIQAAGRHIRAGSIAVDEPV